MQSETIFGLLAGIAVILLVWGILVSLNWIKLELRDRYLTWYESRNTSYAKWHKLKWFDIIFVPIWLIVELFFLILYFVIILILLIFAYQAISAVRDWWHGE